MPLFVPILRLLMLFLNVYDSYKTLKDPPPSSRNAGRPSVRAMSQRKRDMKGCLAVWIVWASFSVYERTAEAIVCLFIPFYDEFKSLALLFLILTRARGAEPIYLHVIRPLVRPYTRTLDATLEVMLYVGDFVFALSTYPIRIGLDWYSKKFGSLDEASSSESDSQSNSSYGMDTPENPPSLLASPRVAHVKGSEVASSMPFPRKISNGISSFRSSDRHTSTDTGHPRHVSSKTKHNLSGDPDIEPVFLNDKGSSKEQLRNSSQEAGSKETSQNPNGKPLKPPTSREVSGSSSHHQIWYPPRSSYVNDELDGEQLQTLQQGQMDQAVLLALEQQQYEEWRQYPPFPSAYPPTPVATASKLVATSALLSLQPAIEEEQSQEGFRQSLLPPREPLNPSHAGDLSDKYKLPGISPSHGINDTDDSMSADEYLDEDDFDITLRTPLPLLGTFRSHVPPRPSVSLASASSAVSVPSGSSALTTTIYTSAMQIDSSSLSDSSSSLSALKPHLASPSVSVIGKKRSLPKSKMTSVRNRVRQIDSETSDLDTQQKGSWKPEQMGDANSPASVIVTGNGGKVEAIASSLIGSAAEGQEDIHPEEKRRKVVRSSKTPKASRTVHPRPVRQRVARYASPPSQSQKAKLPNFPGRTSAKNPVRLHSGTSTRKVKENEDPSSLSASSSATQSSLAPVKSGRRAPTRKQT